MTGAWTRFVTGQPGASALAINGTTAYFTTPTAVESAPLAGGPTVALVSGPSVFPAIAVDATNAYWPGTQFGAPAILKMPLAGGNVVALASGQNHPSAIAVDATRVYCTDNGNGTVM